MKKDGYRVRHVANAGLLFEAEGLLLGIDVFSRDDTGLYPDTPPAIRRELLEEIGECRLHTLIFTHGHGDHFCREDVLEAWGRNPGLRVVSTEAVAEELCRAGMPRECLQAVPGGIQGLSVPDGQKEGERGLPDPWGNPASALWMNFGVFRVGIFNSLHEGAQYAQVQNLTLLLEAGDQRWVVSGDAAASRELFSRVAAWAREIDWFFLPFPYVGLPSNRRMLEKELKIRHIFALHQPRPEADTQGWWEHAKAVCRQAKDELPMPLFPERPGQWYTLAGFED